MRARIPAGIELEDQLLYGLSPARLGYVAAFAVLAIWFWRQRVPVPLRLLPALVMLACGAAAGWLRHEGRHLDTWAADVLRHGISRYRVEVAWGAPALEGSGPRARKSDQPRVDEKPLKPAVPVHAPPEVAVLLLGDCEPP